MKRTLLAFTLLFSTLYCNAQGWEWARWAHHVNAGGGGEAPYCTTDSSGDIYSAGYFFGSIAFGNDTVKNISGGVAAAMIVKYDSSGNAKWARSTSHGYAAALGVAVDKYYNAYLLGEYDSTVTIGNVTYTNPHPARYLYFISKIDSSGNIRWVKPLGDISSYSAPQGGITVDNRGNLLITCNFSNNPTIGTFYITNSNTDSSNDIFVGKLDSSGSVIWAKSFGGRKNDEVFRIAATPKSNIYLAGDFHSDSLLFDAFVIKNEDTIVYNWAIFLAKLDSNGTTQWARGNDSMGSFVYGLASDTAENAYIAGCYPKHPAHFGNIALQQPPGNENYGFLTKFDANNNPQWGKCLQGSYLIPFNATIDPCGNIWLMGAMGLVHMTTNDTIDGHILTPPPFNGDPNFLAGWESNGAYITSSALGSGSFDDPNGIASDRFGNIYVVGEQEDCDTMIVANDTNIDLANGAENMFLAKFNPGLNCITPEKVAQRTTHYDFDIFPNPATNTLTIQYNNTNKATAGIYDITGRLMGSYPLTGNSTTISVQYLPPGIYQYRIEDDKHNAVTKKLVIMH
ncbi:MAG: T9SS type A sorting domain-containing protein [Bacteroidetes bacterium]|nr:T9SS type A sorting domain-containing protein [Bacteroidota bacterium]